MFDGKYFEWNQKRIKTIVDFYGHKFFYMKKVLDLGCAYGDMGGVLYRLGADVTGVDVRQDHLKIVSKKFSGIKVIRADLDNQWPFGNKKFDLILSLGLMCHLENYEEHLKTICAAATNLVLETAVCDSQDPQKCIIVDQDRNVYDLAYGGKGSYPSPAAIEKVLTECGMTFKRMDHSKLNAPDYQYDWRPSNDDSIHDSKRRMWFCVKNSSPIQFAPKIIGEQTKQKIISEQTKYQLPKMHKSNSTVILQTTLQNDIYNIEYDKLIIEYKSLRDNMDLEKQIINNKIDLKNATFIIPICIESEDRAINAKITLSYLCKYLNTNIIVYEYDVTSKLFDIIKNINTYGNKIEHIFAKNDTLNNVFHRTKFLNEMLVKVKTPIVINYDIDILLPPKSYRKFTDLILSGNDLVYPYCWKGHQYLIDTIQRQYVSETMKLDGMPTCKIGDSQYGHCQFFNTKSYIDGGMENEEFISWGPEDKERGYRFEKLGYKVIWSTDNNDYVYHIEHSRGINSSTNNPMLINNDKLFERIKLFSKEQLRSYYDNINYIKKYKAI